MAKKRKSSLEGLLSKLENLLQRLESLTVTQQGYFSIKQAAAFTGLSAAHIRRAVVGGTLPCSNVGTRDRPTYRISREDIAAWMEKRKAGAFPPPKRKKNGPPQNAELPFSRFFPKHTGATPDNQPPYNPHFPKKGGQPPPEQGE